MVNVVTASSRVACSADPPQFSRVKTPSSKQEEEAGTERVESRNTSSKEGCSRIESDRRYGDRSRSWNKSKGKHRISSTSSSRGTGRVRTVCQ